MPIFVGPHQADDDHVAFLPLKTVHCVHADEMAQGFERGLVLDKVPQVLHLGAVRRDDAHVDALFYHTLPAYFVKIFVECGHGEGRLGAVDPSIVFTHKFLVTVVEMGGVNPCDGQIPIENAAIFHLRSTLHLSAVKPVARKTHDGLIHAVLHLQ